MQLKNSLPSLLIFAILCSISSSPVMADTPEVAAWIESISPKDSLSKSKIVILRQGKPFSFDTSRMMTELKSGDRILINDSHVYLSLLTSTGRLRVTADIAKKDGYEINASPNSVWRNLVALVTDKIKPGQTQAISGSTRGGCLQPEEINFPSIPADQTEAPKMAAGERALHFIWQCGKAPYRLSIVQNDKALNEIKVTEGFEATLPKQTLKPGTYKLVLSDKKGQAQPPYGNAYVTENLILVDPADVPPMPAELAQSSLPEETKQLLYADWLARQGKGEWSMEAIQQVFPYAKDYEPAANWLRQWGGK
jgi:hypothetical protein